MNSDPERNACYWHRRAEEVRLAAVGMMSPEAKAMMMEIAAAYLRLVDRAKGEPSQQSDNPDNKPQPRVTGHRE